MVQIAISKPQQDEHGEWHLLDLQGTLEFDSPPESSETNITEEQMHLGTLEIDESSSKATLTIGTHKLIGKRVQLPKPFALLVQYPTSITTETMMDTSDDFENPNENNGPNGKSRNWQITAIIRHKVVFSSRPQHIIREGHKGLISFKK